MKPIFAWIVPIGSEEVAPQPPIPSHPIFGDFPTPPIYYPPGTRPPGQGGPQPPQYPNVPSHPIFYPPGTDPGQPHPEHPIYWPPGYGPGNPGGPGSGPGPNPQPPQPSHPIYGNFPQHPITYPPGTRPPGQGGPMPKPEHPIFIPPAGFPPSPNNPIVQEPGPKPPTTDPGWVLVWYPEGGYWQWVMMDEVVATLKTYKPPAQPSMAPPAPPPGTKV